jgi:hypothetical protein
VRRKMVPRDATGQEVAISDDIVEEKARSPQDVWYAMKIHADRVRRLLPLKRRQPDVEEAAGWLWGADHEVGADVEQRGELEVPVCELVKLVGAIEPVG